MTAGSETLGQAGGTAGSGGVEPSVSVAILNHRRPHLLARVLGAVAQLDYRDFEVVVVGDRTALEDYGLPATWARRIRYRCFRKPNICRARNIAIDAAAGEIVAFIDDDAVPEPDWLRQLVLPFQSPGVGAVAGTVRAANGLTIEWQGGHFDRTGTERRHRFNAGITIADAETQRRTGQYLSLMGVNTAFRRQALLDIGGFDQAYRYYLDETDVALRLAEAGWDAAFTTAAEVHHLREANAARSALRTPRNLFEIAASKAYFCRRHLPKAKWAPALDAFRSARIADLDPFIRLGMLRGAGRRALISQLDQGLREGAKRLPDLPLGASGAGLGFLPFRAGEADRHLSIAVVTGWGMVPIRRMRRLARMLADAGHRTTCISYVSGPAARSVTFRDGLWWHSGGTWRFDQRKAGRRVIWRSARARADLAATDRHRQFDVVISPSGGFGASGTGRRVLVDVAAIGCPVSVEPMSNRARLSPAVLHEIGTFLVDLSARPDTAPQVGAVRGGTARGKAPPLVPYPDDGAGATGQA